MYAMRDGQPCVVHGLGGLKDTVHDGVDGFVFNAGSLEEQVDAFGRACQHALDVKRTQPATWAAIKQAAAQARLRWDATVSAYARHLYQTQRH